MTIDALDMPLLDEIQLLIRAVPFTLKQNRKTEKTDNSLQDGEEIEDVIDDLEAFHDANVPKSQSIRQNLIQFRENVADQIYDMIMIPGKYDDFKEDIQLKKQRERKQRPNFFMTQQPDETPRDLSISKEQIHQRHIRMTEREGNFLKVNLLNVKYG
jgi:hypothetical protein